MAEHRVLVYGTLREGSPNTHTVKGHLHDIGAFPGIILDPDGDDIVCEERVVDDDQLTSFDRYEGYRPSDPKNSLYIRRTLDDGRFIYEFNSNDMSRYPIIESGDWMQHKAITRKIA